MRTHVRARSHACATRRARGHARTHACTQPALSESFGEHFYRSWCVSHADGKWGGPQGCAIWTYGPFEKQKPASRRPAGELLPQDRLLATTDLLARLEALCSPFVHLSDLQF
eukprot:15479722-Alexandrium_andersonii.AAC.1